MIFALKILGALTQQILESKHAKFGAILDD